MLALRRLALPLIAAAIAGVPAAAALAKAGSNPETDATLGPSAGPGHFLGYPSPTSSWHGCTKEDTQWWPVSLVTGSRTTTPSSHRYVTFSVNQRGYPRFTWKARAGYRICGVQAAVELYSPQVSEDLLAEASYTSGPTTGATAKDGRETVKVRIPHNGIGDAGFKQFEGKAFSIFAFQAVSVFVKKGEPAVAVSAARTRPCRPGGRTSATSPWT
jgi:hypothetical protein